jgi:hypothetical protein
MIFNRGSNPTEKTHQKNNRMGRGGENLLVMGGGCCFCLLSLITVSLVGCSFRCVLALLDPESGLFAIGWKWLDCPTRFAALSAPCPVASVFVSWFSMVV